MLGRIRQERRDKDGGYSLFDVPSLPGRGFREIENPMQTEIGAAIGYRDGYGSAIFQVDHAKHSSQGHIPGSRSQFAAVKPFAIGHFQALMLYSIPGGNSYEVRLNLTCTRRSSRCR